MNEGPIAIFLPSLRGGGAERMMLNLAQGFLDAGYAVDLVLAKAEGAYLDLIPRDVRVVDLRARRVLKALPGLVRYLRDRRPSCLLSALDHANVVALLAHELSRIDTPIFVSVRDTLSISARGSPRVAARLLPFLARHLYPSAQKVIAVSRGVARDLVERVGLPSELVKVVYNPVVSPDLAKQAAMPLDHPWFGRGQPPVILGAGRLTRQKDFSNLINAFARLREQRVSRLIILGEGPERQILENRVERMGLGADVSLPGFIANPFPYMRNAAVFALSSAWEGLPGVLIQAMACGTPVVSTDCPNGPREILEGGRYGPLVPVGDELALARAILDTLNNPLSPELLRAYTSVFSVDAVTRQYLELFGAVR